MGVLTDTAIVFSHPAWRDGDDSGWWWIGRLAMLILWTVLIVCLFLWFRRSGGWRGHHEYRPTSLERGRDILAERYAKGEISTEEYIERLESLERINGTSSNSATPSTS